MSVLSGRICGWALYGRRRRTTRLPIIHWPSPTTPGTEQFPTPSPKSQTASPTTTHCQHLSPRRSARWAPHDLESRPHRHPAGELHYMRVRHAGDTLCDCLVSCKTPTTASMEGARRLQDRAQCRLARKNSPNTGLPTALARKTRPAHLKTAFFAHFKPAGRTFSRSRTLQAARGELFRASMKPPPPLLAHSRVRMKPATPLLAHNAPKSSISCVQRCQRFHPSTKIGPQWCHRFQPHNALHRIGKRCTG